MKSVIQKFLLLTALFASLAFAPLQASFFDNASDWVQEKTQWVKKKARVAKNKIKSVVTPEINTVKELTKNIAKVIGGGTLIVYGGYLANQNLIKQYRQNRFYRDDIDMKRVELGLVGVVLALIGAPILIDGAKELAEKRINFEAIGQDLESYFEKQ